MAALKIQVTQGVANKLTMLSDEMGATADYAESVFNQIRDTLEAPEVNMKRVKLLLREQGRVVRFLKQEAVKLDRNLEKYLPYQVT